ncbi:MAG TPA: DUF3592 domain-containing protein [candidate division Zixibacteria bacterium]|nr:DUF3592 domain-containing protein [candidate division Zixibacteria bacterium]
MFLTTVTIAGALLTGLIIGRFGGVRVRGRNRRRVALIGALVGAAGLALLVTAGSEVSAEFARRGWPSVAGVVVESWVSADRAQRPQVKYRYTVAGVEYTSVDDLGVSGFGSQGNRAQTARTVIGEYPPGGSVIVYYDPGEPSESLLRPSLRWAPLMRLTVGALLLSAAGFLLSVALATKPAQASAV